VIHKIQNNIQHIEKNTRFWRQVLISWCVGFLTFIGSAGIYALSDTELRKHLLASIRQETYISPHKDK
jgi:hypothetical protein